LDNIKSKDFKSHKEGLLTIQFLFDQRKDLDQTKRQELIQLILVKDDWQGVRRVLDVPRDEDSKPAKSRTKGWGPSRLLNMFTDDGLSPTQKLIQQARGIATHMSDPDFLMRLKDIPTDDETLKATVTDTENMTQSHLNSTISKLLKKLVHSALHIQEQECTKQIQREAASQAKKDADRFRTEFICQIEEHSKSESNS
jgi:hypothetical protein